MLNLKHIGTGIGLFPPYRVNHPSRVPNADRGVPPILAQPYPDLNYLEGEWLVASRIFTLLLLQKGEYPHLPWLGFAPKLYDSFSSADLSFYVYHVNEIISTVNHKIGLGIESFWTETTEKTKLYDRLDVNVRFKVARQPQENVLTYGYSEHINALETNDLEQFREGLYLNGEPFAGFG